MFLFCSRVKRRHVSPWRMGQRGVGFGLAATSASRRLHGGRCCSEAEWGRSSRSVCQQGVGSCRSILYASSARRGVHRSDRYELASCLHNSHRRFGGHSSPNCGVDRSRQGISGRRSTRRVWWANHLVRPRAPAELAPVRQTLLAGLPERGLPLRRNLQPPSAVCLKIPESFKRRSCGTSSASGR